MEHSTIVIIDGRDVDKIFDLAKEYFPTQGFKWVRENKPVTVVYKRGGTFGITTKGVKTTLTVSFRQEESKTTINAHYQLPSGMMTEGSRKIYNDEINGFKNFVESSIPAVKQSPPEPEAQSPKPSMTCPKCNKQVSSEFAVCPFCATPLKTENKCKKCGKELIPEFKVCPYCGSQL
jgi:RNA polymerase subunit RPABC4/transcription elongation factor Spt4